MNKAFRASLVSLAAFAAFSASAQAATDTGAMNIKINIIASCDIHTVAPTDVDFGSRTPFETNVAASGVLTVKCTNGTTYTITLNDGTNSIAVGARRLKNGTANFIPYGLFKEAAFTNAWGNLPAQGVTGTGNGANQNLTVYGRVPTTAGAIGAYTDIVTATVTY